MLSLIRLLVKPLFDTVQLFFDLILRSPLDEEKENIRVNLNFNSFPKNEDLPTTLLNTFSTVSCFVPNIILFGLIATKTFKCLKTYGKRSQKENEKLVSRCLLFWFIFSMIMVLDVYKKLTTFIPYYYLIKNVFIILFFFGILDKILDGMQQSNSLIEFIIFIVTPKKNIAVKEHSSNSDITYSITPPFNGHKILGYPSNNSDVSDTSSSMFILSDNLVDGSLNQLVADNNFLISEHETNEKSTDNSHRWKKAVNVFHKHGTFFKHFPTLLYLLLPVVTERLRMFSSEFDYDDASEANEDDIQKILSRPDDMFSKTITKGKIDDDDDFLSSLFNKDDNKNDLAKTLPITSTKNESTEKRLTETYKEDGDFLDFLNVTDNSGGYVSSFQSLSFHYNRKILICQLNRSSRTSSPEKQVKIDVSKERLTKTVPAEQNDLWDDWLLDNRRDRKSSPESPKRSLLSEISEEKRSETPKVLESTVFKQYENQVNKLNEQQPIIGKDQDLRLQHLESELHSKDQFYEKEMENLKNYFSEKIEWYQDELKRKETEHTKRQNDIKETYEEEIDRLKEIHSSSINDLKNHHRLVLDRVKEMKQIEVDAAQSASAYSHSFTDVIEQMHTNISKIDDLQNKVATKDNEIFERKHLDLNSKEQEYELAMKRLEKEKSEIQIERNKLQETVQRLEVHLSEQTKLLEDERWKCLQETRKSESMRNALDEERRLLLVEIDRKKEQLDRFQENLLQEQKHAMLMIENRRQDVYLEKDKATEIRERIEKESFAEKRERLQIKMEIEANRQIIQEKRNLIDSKVKVVERREVELIEKSADINRKENGVVQLQKRIEEREKRIGEMLNMLEKEKNIVSFQQKEVIDAKCQIHNRLKELNKYQQITNCTEGKLEKVYEKIKKEKRSLSDHKNSLKCSNCKAKLEDVEKETFKLNIDHSPFTRPIMMDNGPRYTIAQKVHHKLQNKNEKLFEVTLEAIRKEMRLNEERLKDEKFFQNEKQYLSEIRHTRSKIF
ncbi:hypothetical protein SNEBB_006342 [Seison nebaliae]|nr:hypothetical protein SNEBB_006342 [Seison nebaliae]